MPGLNNFLQFNPSAANQESDAAYAADTTRSGGLITNQAVPSPLLNKTIFQSSTFVAALAAALAAKGYNITDSNLGILAGVLANMVTNADLTVSSSFSTGQGYIKLGAAFGGLIIQWGSTTALGVGLNAVAFHIPFVNNLPVPLAFPNNNFTVNFVVTGNLLNQFTIQINSVTGTTNFFWIAIGN